LCFKATSSCKTSKEKKEFAFTSSVVDRQEKGVRNLQFLPLQKKKIRMGCTNKIFKKIKEYKYYKRRARYIAWYTDQELNISSWSL
jgi:hypothetical protein